MTHIHTCSQEDKLRGKIKSAEHLLPDAADKEARCQERLDKAEHVDAKLQEMDIGMRYIRTRHFAYVLLGVKTSSIWLSMLIPSCNGIRVSVHDLLTCTHTHTLPVHHLFVYKVHIVY